MRTRQGAASRVQRLAAIAIALAVLACGCAGSSTGPVKLRFWAMGLEGELLPQMIAGFEKENPGVQVEVQQIPWSSAHEKMLTAHVGGSTPDVAQLGNTWVAEFSALNAIEPLGPRLAASPGLRAEDFFPGIWETNVIGGEPQALPWYVDTRVLFYRTDMLARAGFDSMPGTWDAWRESMRRIRSIYGKKTYGIFLPTNEYTPWIVLGMQAGSPLLKDHDSRGAFEDPEYRRAMDFYLGLFREQLAPAIQGQAIANLYQEFERGTFAMYITGPWNVGEFRKRLSPAMNGRWATAPLPGPDGPASGLSTAGGSSLVIFRGSRHKDAAWKLIQYLSRPEQQLRFYALTGDLPARVECWSDPSLAGDASLRTFGEQLKRVRSTPRIPEWEQISIRLQDRVETVLLGGARADSAMAALDRDVDQILEKRRWLLARNGPGGRP